jgi:hypoxanthine phosphoribosyltransferase
MAAPARSIRTSRASRTPVPACWRGELDFILISESRIRQRIAGLAREIGRDYLGRDLVIVALLNGTVVFLADLVRRLSLPLHLDFIGVSSYGSGTVSGRISFTKELKLDVRGRDVLLLDDILDTGRTLARVRTRVEKLEPRSIATCVLLDKKAGRTEAVEADYAGFEIPDKFVVGYGLDFAERYRNLPFIAVLKKHLYSQAP